MYRSRQRKEFDRIIDSQRRSDENDKTNQRFTDHRWQFKQGARYEYPEYEMNMTRNFNKDFLRRRMSLNQQAYRQFYFYQRR